MTDFSQERGNMEVDDLEIYFHKTEKKTICVLASLENLCVFRKSSSKSLLKLYFFNHPI